MLQSNQVVFPGHESDLLGRPSDDSRNDSGLADNDESDLRDDDSESKPTIASNEALPLVTNLKRPRLSDGDLLNVTSVSTPSTNGGFPYSQSCNGAQSNPLDNPIDTEAVARDVRIVLRQKGMRQTDLAPYIGCRPGSVAGVIAKAHLHWSQLNDFNKNVFMAMARWVETNKNSASPPAPGTAMHPSTIATPVTLFPSTSLSFSPVQQSQSDQQPNQITRSLPASPVPIPEPLLQPFATAKYVENSGYLLFLEGLHIAVPGQGLLFKGANLSVAQGKRYGLVGPCECGVSTLLKFISKKTELNIPATIDIKLCNQSALDADVITDFSENERAIEYVIQAEKKWAALKELEAYLEPIVKRGENREAFVKLRLVYEQLCFFGSGAAEAKARQLLTGLGFSLESQDSRVKDLSARGRKVLTLARDLFAEPALLLIDRPTNFLDVDAIAWLETYLKNWPTSLIIASQDRCFMDVFCNTIIYVHGQKLFYYQGNFTRFKQQMSAK